MCFILIVLISVCSLLLILIPVLQLDVKTPAPFNNSNPPLPVVTCPDEIEVCYNTAPPFILTGAIPLGGVYWGTGVSNNIFNPQVAGIGTHLINYIFTDGNGCVNSCSFDVLVKPLPAVNAGFPQVFILLPNNIVYLNDASASNLIIFYGQPRVRVF